MSREPPKQTEINIPPDLPGVSAQLASGKSTGSGKGQDGEGQGESAGETVKDALGLLETVKIKDDIEEGLEKMDPDTPDQRSIETTSITSRINKLDVIITVGLYYASLIMDWLTSLGNSTSVGEFFFNIFFASFNVVQWQFGQLDLVASISGMTTTLQTGIFLIEAAIYAVATVTKSKMPKKLGGPLYFGGPFQFIHILKTSYEDYHQSTKSWDAQLSQGIGIISQMLIIVAAISAANTRIGQLGALQPLAYGDPNVLNSNFTPPTGTKVEGEPINVTDTTQVTLAVKNAALFAMATYSVSVFAIIMSSLLNIIQWMADVWRVNNDDLIIYYIFKYFTRLICCYPCLGGSKNKVDTTPTSTKTGPTATTTSSDKPNPLLSTPSEKQTLL
ncbi:5195_t:CDS:2 [Cetraspora pellucida]|uniref:5195_t:CDS:1 n=1 Tax=Cetraspora pellucida TaxID=1433469 RepID=A0ACA9NEZ6_9GLOM|nr:5195_t:CDS:2 [Cetraspora pellucida]